MNTAASFIGLAVRNIAIVLPVLAGIGSYLVFHRYEPHKPAPLLTLIFLLPTCVAATLGLHTGAAYAIRNLTCTFALYFSTILTATVVYRLSPLHPLARYPGPISCKLSKLWLASISLQGKQHLYYASLHDRYGDIVRVGPNELSIIDPDAIKPMMNSQTQMPKGPVWDGRIPSQLVTARSMISIQDPVEHTRRRRLWNRAFNAASLREYEVIVQRRALQFVDMLQKHIATSGTNHIDLAQCISYFSFDFMSDMAFGGGSEMMRFGDTNGLWHLLESGQPLALFLGHVPWLGHYYLNWLPKTGRDLKAFREYAKERARIRQKTGADTKDVYYHLMDEAGVEPVRPSPEQVVADAGLVCIAGSDTTATAMSAIFWQLMRSPTSYRRLQSEVDEVGDEDLMNPSYHARSMPYLNAVINEALRLHPPVLSGSQRAIEKGTGGKMLGRHFVPEGTAAFIHTYTLHRDSRNFSRPDAFVPERWLSIDEKARMQLGQEDAFRNFNASCFLPFSIGSWNCVGKNLALQEMRLVLVLMSRNFDYEFANVHTENLWEDELMDFFVTRKGHLSVILRTRK